MSDTPAGWRKSSFSGNEYECVEVALQTDQVRARDSKDRTGPQLVFGAQAWREFVAAVVTGQLGAP
ncbi:DUF397 domain-containing protein [Actinacidiphila reveromycinica]|uniref:DUF397 domain-containing protein n=1 Tax=Actinacidiphila reveromycinica TaxID=659352 RepID=UPI001F2B8A65|nr:DUF397 domain-containing protein [Streptomyces sp. SN-593]